MCNFKLCVLFSFYTHFVVCLRYNSTEYVGKVYLNSGKQFCIDVSKPTWSCVIKYCIILSTLIVSFFQRSTLSYTRRNVMKLSKPRIIFARGSDVFTINLWNSLPYSTVTAATVSCLKVD